MYHDLIFHVSLREPPILLGEPTVLNKERTGQGTEVQKHRVGSVRNRSSWKPQGRDRVWQRLR